MPRGTGIEDIPYSSCPQEMPEQETDATNGQFFDFDLLDSQLPCARDEDVTESKEDVNETLKEDEDEKAKADAPQWCPERQEKMEWSDYAQGAYEGGWVCANIETCGQQTQNGGKYRWFCVACQNDLCSRCVSRHEATQLDKTPIPVKVMAVVSSEELLWHDFPSECTAGDVKEKMHAQIDRYGVTFELLCGEKVLSDDELLAPLRVGDETVNLQLVKYVCWLCNGQGMQERRGICACDRICQEGTGCFRQLGCHICNIKYLPEWYEAPELRRPTWLA